MNAQVPQKGDVLVIGTGEKATRHELGPISGMWFPLIPACDGWVQVSTRNIDLLIRRGAATLEPKREPYRATLVVESAFGLGDQGIIRVPASEIGKTLELREIPTSLSPESLEVPR